MALFRKLNKPKPFEITPRYWDPEKEKREEREKRIKLELGIKDESDTDKSKEGEELYIPNIKGKFRSAAHGDRAELHDRKVRSTRKMFLYGAILFVVIYFLFTGLPFIESLLENIAN